MKRYSAVTLVCCLLGLSAQANEDLLTVYQQAQAADPSYQAALAQYRADQEVLPQATAALKPSLNLSASSSDNRQEIFSLEPTAISNFNDHGYALSLSQPLFNAPRWFGYKQAKQQIKLAESQLRAAESELILRTAEAYFAILASQDTVAFAQAEETAVGRQLEQIKARLDVGLSPITDVHNAQASYDLATAAVIQAQNDLADNLEQLRQITNLQHQQLATVEQLPLAPAQPNDISQWVQLARAQNPDIAQGQQQLAIQQLQVKRERAAHLPSVDLVASKNYIVNGGRFGDFQSKVESLGVQLNVPFDISGDVRSRTRQAAYTATRQAEINKRTLRQVERDTRVAFLDINSNISRIKALQQAVISANSALESSQVGFEVGTRTIVDVLDAQRDLFRAQRDLSQAKYDYLIAQLRLQRAAGQLSQAHLQDINQHLEPAP